MKGTGEGDSDTTTAGLLFEECLESWESGRVPSLSELERRAGGRSDELRERIALARDIRELSDLLVDASAPADPTRLGDFELRGLLGRGGLSRVYLGYDTRLAREVAVKVLAFPLPGPEAERRIQDEGRSLAKLEHESIVRVYAVGEWQGVTYVAMERVRGPSLREVLCAMRGKESRPEARRVAGELESVAARCRLVARLARALDFCHANGIVHRDVKPGNVLVAEGTLPKLIDFGLASLAEGEGAGDVTRHLYGTAAYLAPEQIESGQSGRLAASDQFALGAVLYELLTLQHPFAGTHRVATLQAISKAAPPSPQSLRRDVPTDLGLIVQHCLELNPEDRYPTAGALADDLEAFLDHRAISVRSPSAGRRLRLWLRRNRRAVGVAGLALLLLSALWSVLVAAPERAARVDFQRAVRARLARLGSEPTPEDFFSVFSGLERDGERARELDSGLLAGFLYPETAPVQEEVWRRALALRTAAWEGDFSVHWSTPLAEREEEYRRVARAWDAVFLAEEASAPGGGHQSPRRTSGTVALPEGGELYRYDPDVLPDLAGLERVDPSRRLDPGFYRCRSSAGGVLRERDFFLFADAPACALELRAPDPALASRMVAVEASEHPLEGGVHRYELGAFRILPAPVSWREVRSVFDGEADWLRARQERVLKLAVSADRPEDLLGDDRPALLSRSQAQEFAVRTGTRLPTPAELWVAYRAGVITVDARESEEWTSAVEQASLHRLTVNFDRMDSSLGDGRSSAKWTAVRPTHSEVERSAFRVALSGHR